LLEELDVNIHQNPELLDTLAASYALGSMHGAARRRFESLAREHPVVRGAVLLWQERLAAMTEIQPEVAPSANVWRRIELAIEADQRVVPVVHSSIVHSSSLIAKSMDDLRRAMSWWRGAAFAAGLAMLLAVAMIGPWRSAPELQFVAVLSDDQSSASLLVNFDPKQQALLVKRVGKYREAADKSLQLWALPVGAAPRSLGVLNDAQDMTLVLADRQSLSVPLLAVSLEPRGGVPSAGGPTGPVLFKGTVTTF
jgi:anti-sigma-K factor RskA